MYSKCCFFAAITTTLVTSTAKEVTRNAKIVNTPVFVK